MNTKVKISVSPIEHTILQVAHLIFCANAGIRCTLQRYNTKSICPIAINMKGILICVFMILILASAGIAKYLDDKREAKENDAE